MKSLIIIWALVLVVGAGLVGVVDLGTMPPKTAYADKFDGDCQPTDTVGRCADKCPVGYSLQGYDKNTGAAVCNLNKTPSLPKSTNNALVIPTVPGFHGK